MATVDYSKDICLMDGTKIKIDISIPVSPTIEIEQSNKDFVEEMIVNQLVRGLKESIDKYKQSELPNQFIKNQKFYISNLLNPNIYGMILSNDEIFVDADAISNIRTIQNGFVFGHEIGHKISRYRNQSEIYQDIAAFLGISVIGHERLLEETFADACGNIVSGGNYYHMINEYMEEEKNEVIKKRCLYNIYK